MSDNRTNAEKAARAAEIQKNRELEDLARHVYRLSWLEDENTTWDDGTPIDGFTRKRLLYQSREFIKNSRFSTPTSQP